MLFIPKKNYGLCIGFIISVCLLIHHTTQSNSTFTQEHYSTQSHILIGEEKTVRRINVHPKLPNLAFPMRKHVHTWIVGVPLTPFKAPLLVLPPIKELFNFLLYKPELLTPVRNQGDCGSCWAFAVTDMLSDRLMITTGGLFHKNLSVQQLMACTDREGCEGGSPEDACLWLSQSKYKLDLEKRIPYTQGSGGYVDSICNFNSKLKTIKVGIQPHSTFSIAQYQEEENYDPQIIAQNVLNIKRELIQGGPVYAAITVYEDLFTFTGTHVYSKTKNSSIVGGHAIEIIGYCDQGVDTREGFSKAYWFCRNSWGEDWPTETVMNGFFTIEMGVNMCGIESRVGFATPQLYATIPEDVDLKPVSDLRYEHIKEYI